MNDLDLLLPREFDRDKLKWATVTDDTPLTIRLDGDPAPMLGTPDTCVAGLAVADRVMVALLVNDDPAFKARRAVVLCKAGGNDHEDRIVTLEEDAAEHETRIDALEAPLFLFDTQNTSGTTTSTGYTSTLSGGGAAACGIAFVAPPSGKVLIHNGCGIVNSAGGALTFCGIYVRTGSSIGAGSDVLVPSNSDAVQHPGTSDFRSGVAKPLSGLTPGASYNVIQVFRVSSGTGTFYDKCLIVEGK